MSKLKNPAIWLLIATMLVSAVIAPSLYAQQEQQLTPEGPYVDKLIFQVIRGRDQALLALEKGDIDMIADFIDAAQVPRLQQNPNVGIARTDRRGFGYGAFNNAKFPGNISEFRQAVAYALDKQKISTDAWGGFSRPIDSPVPPSMGTWSYEDQFTEHYYAASPDQAKALLDKAGFTVLDPATGMRGYKGQKFQLQVFASSGVPVQEVQLGILKANLKAVGIDVATRFVDFNTLLNRIDSGDFNLVFLGVSLGRDADHLIDFFKCDAAYNKGFYRYCNPDMDKILNNMEKAATFEEAVKWSWEAQKLLWKEQPIIPTYMNLLISAYRTDRFEGYLNVPGDGVATGWTYIKVHPKGGVSGGQFKLSIPEPVQSNNILSTNSAYSIDVLGTIYDGASGISRNPYTLNWMSYLAQDWSTKSDPTTGTDLTITFYPNMKWHDGQPFTADDVKFSYDLQLKVEAPFVIDSIRAVDKVEVMSPTSVHIHSTKSGYFEFSRMQGAWLLPKHIWEKIAPENVLSDKNDQPIGTGAFMFEKAVPGEYYVVSFFKDGLWVPKARGGNPPTPVVKTTTTGPPPPPPPPVTTTTPPPGPTVTTPIATGTQPGAAGLPSTYLVIAAVVVIILLIAGYMYTRRKKPASGEMGTSASTS